MNRYNAKIVKIVEKIINDVKNRGDKAVIYYEKKFDKVELTAKTLKVSNKELKDSFKKVNKDFIKSIKTIHNNILQYHKSQIRKNIITNIKGVNIKQKFVPIQTVGIYIPGGNFSYPSTVLMTVIPAKVAGVEKIVISSPPNNLTPEVLVTAQVCGVKEIYRIGGVQAIAALAFGTKTIPKVDKIVGPGNLYVTLAKKMLYGTVGIDMLAGPSEVVVYVDKVDSQTVELVMSDVFAQTEHDVNARAIVVTTIPLHCHSREPGNLPPEFRNRIKFAKVSNVKTAIRRVNELAPEHLVISSSNPDYVIPKIVNAGAIFVGAYSTVALGDYVAGPSHVLPTGQSARYDSGLSVDSFLKRIAVIKYTKASFRKESNLAINLAKVEGMKLHQESVEIRRKIFKEKLFYGTRIKRY